MWEFSLAVVHDVQLDPIAPKTWNTVPACISITQTEHNHLLCVLLVYVQYVVAELLVGQTELYLTAGHEAFGSLL